MHSTRTSWSRQRRVIGKAEITLRGENPRFIVTSLAAEQADARTVYETIYCARGDMENRIKEQQLDLFADRTPARLMRVNQVRLWLASVAYSSGPDRYPPERSLPPSRLLPAKSTRQGTPLL
jgi:hypothetical protein